MPAVNSIGTHDPAVVGPAVTKTAEKCVRFGTRGTQSAGRRSRGHARTTPPAHRTGRWQPLTTAALGTAGPTVAHGRGVMPQELLIEPAADRGNGGRGVALASMSQALRVWLPSVLVPFLIFMSVWPLRAGGSARRAGGRLAWPRRDRRPGWSSRPRHRHRRVWEGGTRASPLCLLRGDHGTRTAGRTGQFFGRYDI